MSLKYIYLSILSKKKHWPKKVHDITQVPSRYNTLNSDEVRKNTNLLKGNTYSGVK